MTDQTILKQFGKDLEGQLIFPEDDAYDEARRSWNGLFDKHPAAIARCSNLSDVVKAVNFVRENGMIFSVRGGGHDYAGNSACDDGLIIDLSQMNNVEIDAENKTAFVEGGATIGKFDRAAQQHGLATPTGTVSTVGIGGLALGGGSGYLSSRFGLTLDNVLEVEIVTADGNPLNANETEHEDLFWAVRGGGGNFGVVTSFKFKLHDVGPEVVSYQAYYPHEDSRKVLQFYREFMANAPAELPCYTFFMKVPPLEGFPKEYHGKTTCVFIACYTGDIEEAEDALKPLRQFGQPFLQMMQPMKYTELQTAFDPGMPKGLRWYSKARYFNELSDRTIGILKDFTEDLPGAYTVAYLEPVAGAMKKPAPSATAFPHRDAAFGLHIFPGWDEAANDAANIDWAKKFYEKAEKEAGRGVYVNLLGHDEEERVKDAYKENYDRLAKIKKKWDPLNLFNSNHNILP